jgi:hypothetical protein
MDTTTKRSWMIRWLLALCALHVLAGALLPWLDGSALLDGYHRGIEAAFWPAGAPAGTRALDGWWLALFGPTVQVMAFWMAALVWLGGRLRDARIWLWLMAGLLVWAPQDMLVSLRAGYWPHVWIDLAALAAMLLPLWGLWRQDRAVPAVRLQGARA